LSGNKAEGLVLGDGKTKAAAKLLTGQGVFGGRAGDIGRPRNKGLTGRKCLCDGKGVARVHGIVTEVSEQRAMHVVGSALGDNIEGTSAGAAQVSTVVGAVDLELLPCILAQGKAHAAGVVVGLTAVHSHAVATAVATIKGEAALRRLLYAEVLVARHTSGIVYARHQQRKSKIVAPVNGQILDVLVRDLVCLVTSLSFYDSGLRGDFHR